MSKKNDFHVFTTYIKQQKNVKNAGFFPDNIQIFYIMDSVTMTKKSRHRAKKTPLVTRKQPFVGGETL